MKAFTSANKRQLISLFSIVVILLLWKAVAVIIDAAIILPSPERVIIRIYFIMKSSEFWNAVLFTTLRTLWGFLISLTAGFITGIACGINSGINAALSPVISIIRTIPVMSVILLAMIWFKTDTVPVFVCFLMIFPIITANVTQGIKEVDRSLLEMASAFRLKKTDTLFHIIIPSAIPFLLAGIRASAGIAWKSVIAAEVLSQPIKSIGAEIQFSQMNLETAEVISWTITAILLSKISEYIIELIINNPRWKFRL